jgi:hypothetical protein
MLATSAGEWVHCGRVFSATEIAELCATVAWLPGLARKELAATVCEHLGWTTLTGTAKISACLDFLERLQAAGLLVLPALRPSPPRRCAPPSASVAPVAEPAVHCALSALAPVSLEVVRDATRVAQWDALVARWHPLGFQGAFGYRLRYFITAGDRRLGCVLLSGAARAVAVRDQWIGWTAQARRENLARVVNNSRFLIFPHVRVPHLASHVLGQLARAAHARTGSNTGASSPCCWRPSSIRVTMPAPATVPPVGSCLGQAAGAGWPALASPITARPARCGSKR